MEGISGTKNQRIEDNDDDLEEFKETGISNKN